MLHQQAYSAIMDDIKMDWRKFEGAENELQNNIGAQWILIQIKLFRWALRSKEVLEETEIRKGFIVSA